MYHRELELSRLKASLVDMKVEIVEEAQTLDTAGQVISPESLQRLRAGEAEEQSSSSEEEGTGSDSGVSGEEGALAGKKDASRKKRRGGGKGKSKGKGRDATRAEERGANWDYNLSVAGGNRRARVAEDDD